MSDNSSGANGNSWTILPPEVKQSGVESVGPLAGGQEGLDHSEAAQHETELPDPKHLSQRSELTDGLTDYNNTPEAPQVTPLETPEDAAVLHTSHLKDPTPKATPVESLTCLSSDPEQQSASHSESEPLLHPDTDSFSDSYTHISPAPESTLHPAASQDEEELSPELTKTPSEESKQDAEVLEGSGNEDDGVRRRKVSLLTPVDHRDDDEEEEAEEEPFRPPPREDIGFSLNKCIFGAVILLALGTIFFSEGDADGSELKDPSLQKEWMNPEALTDKSAGVQPPEILEKLAKESQQIAILQAQLKEQEGELKVAQLQVEEGTKERMRREELERENQRMKGELNKLSTLQELEQENERVKRESEKAKKDLEALPGLQKEVELLRAKVTEFSHSTDDGQTKASGTPSAGHEGEVPTSHRMKEPRDKKSHEKVKEEKEQKKKQKEWKQDKSVKHEKKLKEREGEGKELKKQKEWEKKVHQEEDKEWRGKGERKEWKNEKETKKGKKQDDGKRWKDGEGKRQSKEESGKQKWMEEGKRWKDSEGKRQSKEGSGKREWMEEGKRWKDGEVRREFKGERVISEGKEDKKLKKEKPWQLDGGRWETKESKHSRDKGKEDKQWKRGGERKDGEDEREWKKGRHVASNDKERERKEKNERKKEWNGEKERKNPKGQGKARKESAWQAEKDYRKGSRGKKEYKEHQDKHWNGKEEEWLNDEERAHGGKKEKKHKGDYQRSEEKWSKRDKHEHSSSDRPAHHSYSDQKNSKEHMQDNYWTEQKQRLHHYRGSTEGCSGVTACAHAEGLTPVGQRDFEALLLAYLTKLLGPENQASKKEELNKLISEFFTDEVFVHDRIPFSEFVEDVSDILEDMAEEDEDEEMEDEMEGFAREAMDKFMLPERRGNEEKRRERDRKRTSG